MVWELGKAGVWVQVPVKVMAGDETKVALSALGVFAYVQNAADGYPTGREKSALP
jgi:hypothetical protein